MLEFAWPYALLALPLPLLVFWFAPAAKPKPGAVLKIPFFTAVEGLTAPHLQQRSRLRLALSALAWLLLVLAAGRPQFVGEALSLPVTGRDLLLAVDISGSMQTPDMILDGRQTTRLSAVKRVAGNFIARRTGDRVGLILFGSQAYLQTPLTFDRTTTRTLLYEAEAGLAGKETAIGDAIGLAVKRLRERPQQNRVLILLTDGVNNAGALQPLQAAELAQKEGLRIYTIGVGADEMVVRSFFGNRVINPSAELDEKTLTAIAEQTGGRYFRARDAADLEKIYRLLDELEPVEQNAETFRPVRELYPWPLAFAVLISAGLALAFSGLSWQIRHDAR